MNTEQTPLESRARIHAALAEPARLEMVDLLRVGDRSPGELGERLGLPSNLVAHHLGVLEAAGVIRRTRSEGDGRRSYVTVVPHALDEVSSQQIRAPRVLFVCTGNSARSQLAEAIWRQRSSVPAASAGTHPAPAVVAGAVLVAERNGLDLRSAVPRELADVLAVDDLVVTVCDRAHEELPPSALHWSVPDPIGAASVGAGSVVAFDAAFDDLSRRINDLARMVVAA